MDELPGGARRIAFFGGSFDPPHLGHLAVAQAACAALALDAVLFAPVGAQPLKPQGSTAAFDDRAEMTRLAIAGEPAFSVSLADGPTGSGKPNYTIDTLHRLRGRLPSGGTLFCLMGADSLLGLRNWHRGAEVPFAAQLVVASRPGESLDDLSAALPSGLRIEETLEMPPCTVPPAIEIRCYRIRKDAGESVPLFLLPGLYVEISATEIREKIRTGSAGDLLPAAVAAYIRSHNLYR